MIEELRAGESDVNSLAAKLELPGPRVSQHLSLMRAHKLVDERREGRRHLYFLIQPEIAGWIIEGVDFIEGRASVINKSDIKSARRLWTTSAS